MDIGVCSLVLFVIFLETNEATFFVRKLHVSVENYQDAKLNSKTGITKHGHCAKLCKNEPCLSFAFTPNEKRCDTYSRKFKDDNSTDVAMTTMYFANDDAWRCSVYSESERQLMASGVEERVICEGQCRRYTLGDDAKAPGCRQCWCCERVTEN